MSDLTCGRTGDTMTLDELDEYKRRRAEIADQILDAIDGLNAECLDKAIDAWKTLPRPPKILTCSICNAEGASFLRLASTEHPLCSACVVLWYEGGLPARGDK
jgi:hypothetical protein